jgi:uncharacterized protein (TIGR02246 family)
MTTAALPTTPQQVIEHIGSAFNRGDLDAALALYEPEAAFKVQPGRIVHGRAAIREALAGFFALQPRMDSTIVEVVEAGNIALVTVAWELTGRQPDGQPIAMSGRSADVLRRQPEGHWKVSIDDPWGPPNP